MVVIVFGHETLVPGPSLNERAVHTEMFARKPAILLCGRQDQVKQLNDCVVRNEPFAILRNYRRYPGCVVHRQANEPTKQQVVASLFHQLALRAHAVEHLQQHRTQQLLGINCIGSLRLPRYPSPA